MKKEKEILSSAKEGQRERDELILSLYNKHKDQYAKNKKGLYDFIADKVKISYVTVIRRLKRMGTIETKPRKPEL